MELFVCLGLNKEREELRCWKNIFCIGFMKVDSFIAFSFVFDYSLIHSKIFFLLFILYVGSDNFDLDFKKTIL
uniref:Uncharacterized protein n=1 Tax=Cannabis sativa TaxID=3483 RepID=A0A803R3Q7_CANSA